MDIDTVRASLQYRPVITMVYLLSFLVLGRGPRKAIVISSSDAVSGNSFVLWCFLCAPYLALAQERHACTWMDISTPMNGQQKLRRDVCYVVFSLGCPYVIGGYERRMTRFLNVIGTSV